MRRLGLEFGGTAVDNAAALYQAISAGASDAAEAVQILDAANRLAIAGVTSVEVSIDGLTSVMNAYGKSVDEAEEVSDSMFLAVRAGKTTVEELASSLGVVAPIAATIGVSFDELTASIAALTKGGISTSRAVTNMQQVFAAIVKPSSEAEQLMASLAGRAEEVGFAFNSAHLQSVGLQTFLEQMFEITNRDVDALSQLFGGVEALTAVLALAGQAGVDFNDIMEDMEDKLGTTEEALDKITDTAAFRWDQSMQAVANTSLELGNRLLVVVVPAVELLGVVLRRWSNVIIDLTLLLGAAGLGFAVFRLTRLLLRLRTVMQSNIYTRFAQIFSRFATVVKEATVAVVQYVRRLVAMTQAQAAAASSALRFRAAQDSSLASTVALNTAQDVTIVSTTRNIVAKEAAATAAIRFASANDATVTSVTKLNGALAASAIATRAHAATQNVAAATAAKFKVAQDAAAASTARLRAAVIGFGRAIGIQLGIGCRDICCYYSGVNLEKPAT